jgi:hypothetical protein
MLKNRNQVETVVVTVNGKMIDTAVFEDRRGADAYKQGVRRWARERGVAVRLWSWLVRGSDGASLAPGNASTMPLAI